MFSKTNDAAVLKNDIMDAAGATQLCAGQRSGIEAAIHAAIELFERDGSDALLLMRPMLSIL